MISTKPAAIDKLGISTMLDDLSPDKVDFIGHVIYRLKGAKEVRVKVFAESGFVTGVKFERKDGSSGF